MSILSHRRSYVRCHFPGLVIALLAWLLVPSPILAQEGRTITFDEAIDIALEQNVRLKQAANAVQLQEVGVSRARGRFWPDLRIATSGGQNYGRSFVQEEARIVEQTSERFSSEINSSVNLFSGFGDIASLEQARLQAEASELSYQRTRQEVVFQVMSEFLTLIEQREQIRVQEENLEALRQQLRQIEGFVEVGTRPRSDLYQQQSDVAQADLALLNAEQAYELTKVNLMRSLQLDPFGMYEFEAPAVEDSVVSPPQYDLQTLLQEAYAQRPDLEASIQDIEAAEQGMRVARSGNWPSIGLSVGYGSSFNTASQIPLTEQFSDLNRGGSIGLSLSIPLFDRFNTQNLIQESQVRYETAELALEEQRQDVAFQVRQSFQNYQAVRKRLDVTQVQLQAAEQALEAAQERYNLGAATIVELSDAQSRHVQAQSDRVEAKYDFFFQENLLKYFTGTLDPGAPLFE